MLGVAHLDRGVFKGAVCRLVMWLVKGIASFLVLPPLFGTAKQYWCTCVQNRICAYVCM
jgi:hypothetical protein